jgi:nitric oxide reductase subunit B
MVGGHQMGSVWGHGSYVAPDWTADWLHRESVALLDLWAERETGRKYADLDPPQQASFQARLQAEMRANTYDPSTGTVTISDDRARALATVADHYDRLFGDDPALQSLREDYAIQENPIPVAANRAAPAVSPGPSAGPERRRQT